MRKAEISRESDGQLNLENFYTPMSVAKKEIWSRWNDKELRKKVDNFLSPGILEIFKSKPRAVFCRYVFSPNFEFKYFLDLAKIAGLRPLCLQYACNKFVAKNTPNYHLCRLFFYDGDGKRGGSKIDTLKIVDFNKWEGERLDEINTLKYGNLVDFHNELLKKAFPGEDYEIFDFSKWFNRAKQRSEYYYLHYLALFVCHGVLFENFLTNEEEIEFTRDKVIPSFNKIQEIFGVKPLIFPLNPFKSEESPSWFYYSHKIKKIIKNTKRR